MSDLAVLLLALLVVAVSAAPFLVALSLINAGRRQARLDAELNRLLRADRPHGHDRGHDST